MCRCDLRVLILLLALSSLTAVLSVSAFAADAGEVAIGAGANDSGFRPNLDGFGFQNYGDDRETLDLTSLEMQRMFGNQVCAGNASGGCILTYPAERWMGFAISAMKNGHCEGLAVLSSLMYYNQTRPDDFGEKSAVNLSLDRVPLQREIGYWWTTQATSPGASNKILESPRAVFDALRQSFDQGRDATEWWVIGIFLPDGSGGHAITPIAVEDMGNGSARIYVYDNNWPEEIRFIEIDLSSDSWKYQASVNPEEPDGIYSGNASTKSLEIVSLSSRLGLQRCDFCDGGTAVSAAAGGAGSKGAAQGNQSVVVWQRGKASLLVTDASGGRVGVLESGEEVNEISGAEVRSLKFGEDSQYLIMLPASGIEGSSISINVSGSPQASGANPSETAIFAPGYALSSSVSDLSQGAKESLGLSMNEGAYNVSLRADRQLSPLLAIDSDLSRITLSGLNLEASGMINLSMDPMQGELSMSTLGSLKPGTLKLELTSLDPVSGSTSSFKSMDLMLRTGDGVSMNFADLSGETSLPSLSVSRSGGVQEMSMISVSRDVPVSLPEIPDLKNMTASNKTISIPSSEVAGVSGSSVPPGSDGIPDMGGVSGTEGMPGIAAPAFP